MVMICFCCAARDLCRYRERLLAQSDSRRAPIGFRFWLTVSCPSQLREHMNQTETRLSVVSTKNHRLSNNNTGDGRLVEVCSMYVHSNQLTAVGEYNVKTS